ncbi:MAG: septation protein A [Rhodospirillaceae bacterium]
MKFLFDFLPLLVFFAGYAAVDIFFATAAAMVATTFQIGWSWLKHRKVDTLLWVNFGAVMVFGGLTLFLHDKRFIMIKPTIVYWLMATGLLISYAVFKKNPIRMMMQAHFDAPDRLWSRWAGGWILFFAGLGLLNLFVAYNFSEAIWVKFKVFGALVLTLVLMAVQIWTLMPYAREESSAESGSEERS